MGGSVSGLSLVKGKLRCMLLSFAFQNECIESPGTVQRIFSFFFSSLKGVCWDTRLTQNYRALFSLGMQ